MKILVLVPRPLWPAHDGATVASLNCARGLAEAGARVTVLSMKTEKHGTAVDASDGRKPDWLHEYRTVTVNTTVRPLALLSNFLFSGKPYDLVRFMSHRFSDSLRSSLTLDRYDIIHCEGLVFALYLDEIRTFTPAPVVLRAHNVEHRLREMTAAGENTYIRRFYLQNLSRRLKKLETGAAASFDAIVPISRPDYEWFASKSHENRVFLCETGMQDAAWLPKPDGSQPRVGFIGSFDWQPNIEGLTWFIHSVWPRVLEGLPDATLHIAGKSLDRVKASLPGGRNIVFDSEPADAGSFIASNDLMISPLFAGSGLRIKIIEAMSTGRPVVATPLAAQGIDAQPDSGLALAADTESFCLAVSKYLKDSEFRISAGKAAVRVVQTRFDNRFLTSGLLEFYRMLVNEKPAGGIQPDSHPLLPE